MRKNANELKQLRNYSNSIRNLAKRAFNSFVTGDETWVHIFEPKLKVNNKIWATKNYKRPCVAKRLQSSKKVMFAIFLGQMDQ